MGKTIFQCPVCLEVLSQGDKQYVCANNHSFDIARKGYVNLLLPKHVGSGIPGDSKEMLRSRRAFFNQGYYEPVSDQLNQLAGDVLAAELVPLGRADVRQINILDAGCGEGYYLKRLHGHLAHQGNVALYGTDVSRDAIHYAANSDKAIRFAVASNYHLPIVDHSLDCLICVFAPRDEEEFSRVLKPTGKLIVAAPGERHLYSLRKALYEEPPEIGQRGTVAIGFQLVAQETASYVINLTSTEDILNLLTMTPYSLHAQEDVWTKIKSWKHLTTEIDINLMVYEKVTT